LFGATFFSHHKADISLRKDRKIVSHPNQMSMHVSWTVWKDRNARVFNNKSAAPTILLEIIKMEAKLWVAGGAKYLGVVIPGE
jgi:hypothetical protein